MIAAWVVSAWKISTARTPPANSTATRVRLSGRFQSIALPVQAEPGDIRQDGVVDGLAVKSAPVDSGARVRRRAITAPVKSIRAVSAEDQSTQEPALSCA